MLWGEKWQPAPVLCYKGILLCKKRKTEGWRTMLCLITVHLPCTYELSEIQHDFIMFKCEHGLLLKSLIMFLWPPVAVALISFLLVFVEKVNMRRIIKPKCYRLWGKQYRLLPRQTLAHWLTDGPISSYFNFPLQSPEGDTQRGTATLSQPHHQAVAHCPSWEWAGRGER